jgi:hypothetical protein
MKNFFAVIFTLLIVCFLNEIAFAQELKEELRSLDFPATPSASRYETNLGYRREDRVLKQGLLAPSVNDREALRSFLQGSNTGLIRLLPRELYDDGTYHVEKKLSIRGGGAYYSFTNLTHAYGYASDIVLDHNRLSVGFAGADYGMLTNIGDVPLDQITLNDRWTQSIAAYRPPHSEPKARAEYQRLNSHAGMRFDGFHYQKGVAVQENSTYLLRSIGYGTSDVLVAFRLVRQDSDGSVETFEALFHS